MAGNTGADLSGSMPDAIQHKASRGRFAPSPSGYLHAGSLLAALASYLWNPRWSIRIDDLDTLRVVPGAEASILHDLQRYGLSDANTLVHRQREQTPRYLGALLQLADAGLLYECHCSRRQLAGTTVYPGYCRGNIVEPNQLNTRLSPHIDRATPAIHDSALRVRLTGSVSFDDAVQGTHTAYLEQTVGDVVVHRRDGVFAYALTAAVDDSTDNDDVVRGADLLSSTAAQIALMNCLKLRPPRYAHVPVLVDETGAKLGKQTRAPVLGDPLTELPRAWQALGQQPLHTDSLESFHALASEQWCPDQIPRSLTCRVPLQVPA